MLNQEQLIEQIHSRLEKFNYSREAAVPISNVHYIAYIKKGGILSIKNLCAVVEVPDHVESNTAAKEYFGNIKKMLLQKYGDAFLWKELEMCFVVICSEKLYDILKVDEGNAVDQASFSLNAMLGTSFINRKTLENFPHSTWGLYFSGDHFKAVLEAVDQFCKNGGDGASNVTEPNPS